MPAEDAELLFGVQSLDGVQPFNGLSVVNIANNCWVGVCGNNTHLSRTGANVNRKVWDSNMRRNLSKTGLLQ